MKRATLEDIVCPAPSASGMCGSRLELSDAVPVVESQNAAHGITEGVLRCTSCAAVYPILLGIPVLLGDVRSFLRANYAAIVAMAAELEVPLGSAMLGYLRQQYAHLQTLGGSAAFQGTELHLSQYLAGHYDNLLDTLSDKHPLRDFLARYYQKDFYSAFMETIPQERMERGLDIGCNVGRLSRELAGRCDVVYGVDLTFGPALRARQAALGWPVPLSSYPLFRDGVNQDVRRLELPPLQNVEILVASGMALPFRSGCFDAVAHANTIEMTPAPGLFFAEALRVVRPGGLLSQGSCYAWEMGAPIETWPGGRDGQSSKEWARSEFSKATEILAESSDVPWVLRYWDTSFLMGFVHILTGRKRSGEAAQQGAAE